MQTPIFIDCDQQPETPYWFDEEMKKSPTIYHIPGGRVDPSKIQITRVHCDVEALLDPRIFLERAQKIPGAANACAFDFFQKPENQHYLGTDQPEGTVLVFPRTVFKRETVRALMFDGRHWNRRLLLDVVPYDSKYKVAVFPLV